MLAMLPALQQLLAQPVMRWLGKVSFSLYLTHIPLEFSCVAAGFSRMTADLPHALCVMLAGVLGVAGSLALATLFERWIDRPAVRLSRAVSVRPAGAVQSTVLISAETA